MNKKIKLLLLTGFFTTLGLSSLALSDSSTEPVIIEGTVPDEETKAIIIQKLKTVYGETRVQAKLNVNPSVRLSPNWNTVVDNAITDDLKKISKGRLEINGPLINLFGNISETEDPNAVADTLFKELTPIYQVNNNLQVQVAEQKIIDKTLGNRIIEFSPASADLTPLSLGILDQMAVALQNVGEKKVKIIGHTDSVGDASENQVLSEKRAQTVKDYLIGRDIDPDRMTILGMGANLPIATNDTEAGRKRNRRIEFKLTQ